MEKEKNTNVTQLKSFYYVLIVGSDFFNKLKTQWYVLGVFCDTTKSQTDT